MRHAVTTYVEADVLRLTDIDQHSRACASTGKYGAGGVDKSVFFARCVCGAEFGGGGGVQDEATLRGQRGTCCLRTSCLCNGMAR